MAIQDAHLQWVLSRAAGAVASLQDLGRRHSAAQLAWKPSPQEWSMLECVEHLDATAAAYHPGLRAVLDQTRQRNVRASGPFRSNFLVRAFIRSIEPQSQRKLPAPQLFRPHQGSTPDVGAIDRYQQRLRELVDNVATRAGFPAA